MSRIIPLTGTDENRQIVDAGALLRANELHTTSDQRRVFVEGYLSGPVWHGSVGDEAAMLALTTVSPRGVFPMDECFRSDTETVWKCIANRGVNIDDWLNNAVGSGISSESVLDGGAPGDTTDDEVDGGAFGDMTDDEVDGNDEL